MPQAIRIWEVGVGNTLREVPLATVNQEEFLEQWLESDISMISSDLMVIGRQVPTDFGGYIDLLCLDSRGDLVVIELKRGKTPRDVTAQSLDYASWVKGLSSDRVTEIANQYLEAKGPLEDAFRARFQEELPEILNESHQIIIVAEEMDDSTERIVRYLSAAGIGINVATVQHFRNKSGQEMLAQVFLIEPASVPPLPPSATKRRRNLTYEQLQSIAEEKGVGHLYTCLIEGLNGVFEQRGTTVSSISFRGKLGAGARVIFSLFPTASDSEAGLYFQVYAKRLATYLGMAVEQVPAILPVDHKPWTFYAPGPEDLEDWSGYDGYFKTKASVETFLNGLSRRKG